MTLDALAVAYKSSESDDVDQTYAAAFYRNFTAAAG